jgi:hypothetical protein
MFLRERHTTNKKWKPKLPEQNNGNESVTLPPTKTAGKHLRGRLCAFIEIAKMLDREQNNIA